MSDPHLFCCPNPAGCRGHIDLTQPIRRCPTCGYTVRAGELGPEQEVEVRTQSKAEWVTFRLPCGHGDTLLRGWWGEASLDSLWEDRKCTQVVRSEARQTYRTIVDPMDGSIRRVPGEVATMETMDYKRVPLSECLKHIVSRERYQGAPLPPPPSLAPDVAGQATSEWRQRVAGLR